MNLAGLALCSRYSYPPNSLSLCGPDKKTDLKWYSTYQQADKGTGEILSQFSTLYPYLTLIASENKIKDLFDQRVVEAYWLGNNLLYQIPLTRFVTHLRETLKLKKKMKRKELEIIFTKLTQGGLPHHSFHVLNVGKRTGHLDISPTIETINACLINWGRVKRKEKEGLVVETRLLRLAKDKLIFGQPKEIILMLQGEKDLLATDLSRGDFVSYHWGYFCQKLTSSQLGNLIYYTNLSLSLANKNSIDKIRPWPYFVSDLASLQ